MFRVTRYLSGKNTYQALFSWPTFPSQQTLACFGHVYILCSWPVVWSSTIQDFLFWWGMVWLELFSEDLLPLAFKQVLITTSWQKNALLNLMNTPSQILPFMAQRGVKSNPQPPEANAIWFFSLTLNGNCSEVLRDQLLVKSNGWFYFSFVDCRAICHLSFWAAPCPRYLAFHHLQFLLVFLLSLRLFNFSDS